MLDDTSAALDRAVRATIYNTFAERGVAPMQAEIARAVDAEMSAVAASMARLAAAHVLVLDEAGDVRMAMPFSAVPTPFRVHAGELAWWANCAWDALGIAAATGRDVEITTECACCDAALALAVRGGMLAAGEGVAHFAVPAARWWDDIGYT